MANKQFDRDSKIALLISLIFSFLVGIAASLISYGLQQNFPLSGGIGLILALISGYLTFMIPPLVSFWRSEGLHIYGLLYKLGKQFLTIDFVDKTKLRIFLMSILMPRKPFLELKTDVKHYIDIQVAGAFFARKELFTTYTGPIEKWNRLGILLERYTRIVKNIPKKERYIIRPRDEIINCLEHVMEYEIFLDTIETMKACLWLVPKEIIQKRGYEIKDFLLYDDKIVIIGSNNIEELNEGAKTSLSVNIIVDPELRHEYLGHKSKLSELREDKDKFKLANLEEKTVEDTLLLLKNTKDD